VFSLFILKLCSINGVVEYGPQLLEWAKNHHLEAVANWILKYTFFKNFVPGETAEECSMEVKKLKRNGLGVILEYSNELGDDVKDFDQVTREIIDTIDLASRDPASSFACLKVSTITSYSLLERMTTLIQYYNDIPASLPFKLDNTKYSARPLPSAIQQNSPPPNFTPEELKQLQELLNRMDQICKACHTKHVKLLVDAEETYYQPAIDMVTLCMIRKYNKLRPLIFNTYQMYLRGAPRRLAVDINTAKKEGYYMGVKLVRGAYMYKERARSQSLDYPDPINPTIEGNHRYSFFTSFLHPLIILSDTHKNYYKGIDLVLPNLNQVGLMIATHNEETIIRSIEKMQDRKIDPLYYDVQFAQLYGMADHLSLYIAQNRMRVYKYIPFGPIEYPSTKIAHAHVHLLSAK
jgi:proline dehydrogenase